MSTSILWYQARKTRVAGLLRLWHTEALAFLISEEEAPCATPVLPSFGSQDFILERLLFQNS